MRRVTDADDPSVRAVSDAEAKNFSEPMSENAIKNSLLTEPFGLYVYEIEGRVVSYAATGGVFPEMQINSVASIEKRKGYAKAMLTEILSVAKKNGIETVSLEVRESNKAAIALYEALGFRKVGKRKNLYEKPTEDGYVMITELQKQNACFGN